MAVGTMGAALFVTLAGALATRRQVLFLVVATRVVQMAWASPGGVVLHRGEEGIPSANAP